jgi:hypothetical protein
LPMNGFVLRTTPDELAGFTRPSSPDPDQLPRFLEPAGSHGAVAAFSLRLI